MRSTAHALPRPAQLSNDEHSLLLRHIELIMALTSGLLIMIAWLLMRADLNVLSVVLYLSAYVIGGYHKAIEGIQATLKDKKLNVELLMITAATGAAIIGYWTEGAILIFIFALSGALETYTMNKSRNEISSLMDLQPQEAWIVENGVERKVSADSLEPGDQIIVRPGERVPADGIILSGRTTIDEAAFTGESIPVSKDKEMQVMAGTVNLTGLIEIKVTKKSDETMFQKIIELVQSAQSEKPPSQLFIERFEGTYVKGVLLFTGIMLFLPYLAFGWSYEETFYRAMVLLVVASPCALVASIMPASLSAISNGAKKGILFKGGVHLENLTTIKAIAFDKTGTLTQGKPEVTNWYIRQDQDKQEIVAAVASIEKQSNHPLAQAIASYAERQHAVSFKKPESVEDVTGFGLKATFNGDQWRIGKADWFSPDLKKTFDHGTPEKYSLEGKTIVFIEKNGTVLSYIALKDQVRPQTIEAIKYLKSLGIRTIMLTGDSDSTARTIMKETGVDQYKAECLPEMKVEEIKKLKAEFQSIAMVGDGINDAPALATATVGVAMGAGSDAALETADVVLVKNDLPKIAEAIRLSRKMHSIVKQNIVFSLSVITILVVSNLFQAVDLPLGVIGHEGSTILVILNGLRLLKS
ncbi:heavy metal translocating P-type ATPase [Jeotgalibacillus sp. R-1-5s-1]|uniref:heavy metal translocating P-type ATPase n=1 Tax=Jeotgalibacillus sp. R-1-5s-1 TaxID=2555897 RepID=UPI00106AC9BA|nr:heavy metal translocating P-type ATPase [Jeotgalibacillus sp. R-1-5s-1]TFE01227.1 cadmium-translocating P-type ATPase [Jeotgalibacillus sp. R-1-5s-1]